MNMRKYITLFEALYPLLNIRTIIYDIRTIFVRNSIFVCKMGIQISLIGELFCKVKLLKASSGLTNRVAHSSELQMSDNKRAKEKYCLRLI